MTGVVAAVAGRLGVGMGRAGSLARRGTLALVDEGLVSASNFALGLLLARWLSPAGYGLYALLYYTVATGVVGMAGALVLQPMTVLGPARHARRLRAYLGAVLRVQGLAALGIVLLLAAAAALVGAAPPDRSGPGLPAALLGLAACVVGTAYFQFRRRACYILGAPGSAAWRAALYGASLAGAVLILRRLGMLQVGSSLAAIGSAGLVAGLWPLPATARAGWADSRPPTYRVPRLGAVAGELWGFGRWLGVSSLADWGRQNLAHLASAVLLGLGGTGQLQAVVNLAKPFPHLLAAFGNLALPGWAARAGREGPRAAAGVAARWAVAFAGLGLGYAAAAGAASPLLFARVYGGRYALDPVLVGLVLLTVAVNAAGAVVCLGLNAAQRPGAVLASQAAGLVGSSVAGLPLALALGLRGVAAWALAAAGVQAAVGAVLLARTGGETSSRRPSGLRMRRGIAAAGRGGRGW